MGMVITDGTGRVLAFSGDSLGAQTDERARETALTMQDFAKADEAGRATQQPYDVVFDGTAFAHRTRAKSAAELDEDERVDLIRQLQAALDGWAGLTAAQKDGLLRLCVRAALRALRRGA